MLCEKCEEDQNNEDDIVQWGYGKYYKRFILGYEKELENEDLEMKNKIEYKNDELNKYGRKEAIKILKQPA